MMHANAVHAPAYRDYSQGLRLVFPLPAFSST